MNPTNESIEWILSSLASMTPEIVNICREIMLDLGMYICLVFLHLHDLYYQYLIV